MACRLKFFSSRCTADDFFNLWRCPNLVIQSSHFQQQQESVRVWLIVVVVWFALCHLHSPIFEDGQIGPDDLGDFAADWRA